MMKLYYAPGACSVSPHIALREAGLPVELVRVDFMRGKRLADGGELSEVNPKNYVPALVLEDGELLTEVAVMLQYLADLRPESGLAPAAGTFERVRLQEWLNFIATELHKGVGPFFMPQASDELKQAAGQRLAQRLSFVAERLGTNDYLMGERFTVADAYLFFVLRLWQGFLKGDVPPGLAPYYARIEARPAVQAALEAERQQ